MDSSILTNAGIVRLQLFTYPSISPFSGVISPTTFSLLASPMATPRTTPRSTPIPRGWAAAVAAGAQTLMPLEGEIEYNTMMAALAASSSAGDDISEGKYTVATPSFPGAKHRHRTKPRDLLPAITAVLRFFLMANVTLCK